MWNVVLLIALAVAAGFRDTSGYNIVESPIDHLSREIDVVNDLLKDIQTVYKEDIYRHPRPRNYFPTLGRTCATLSKIPTVVRQISKKHCQPISRMFQDDLRQSSSADDDFGRSSRGSINRNLVSQINFYKALSRALRKQFKDEPMIRDNIHDGLRPPTRIVGHRH